MKVHELHAALTEHIAHGRGDDDVYVINNDEYDFGHLPFETVMAKNNWAVIGMDWTDDEDAYVSLRMEPE